MPISDNHLKPEAELIRGSKRLTQLELHLAGVVVYFVALAIVFTIALVLMLFETGTVIRARARDKSAPTAAELNPAGDQRPDFKQISKKSRIAVPRAALWLKS